MMTADQVFSIANLAAVLGWIVLAAGVALKRDQLVTLLAGRVWPISFAVLYTVLIIFFFGSSPGGFDSLAHVQLLFTSPWAATAGWIHYLAFDLFTGSWISAQVIARQLPRLALIIILPLTFLFGPIGLLLFFITRLAFERREAVQ
jgi:hypothetical protein